MNKGLKILLALYDPSKDEESFSEEDFSLAKDEGYLFDYPEFETHSESLSKRRSLLARIDPRDLSDAFLFSLSSRRLDYRSALGSYYYIKAVPEHEILKSHNKTLVAQGDHCYLCGWSAWKTAPDKSDIRSGLNYFNWLRYKYGGSPVGDMNYNYALFDLEQFIKLPKVIPSEEDRKIFREILSCAKRLESGDKAGRLRDAILKAKIFRTNKDEISVLLGALGTCGILAGKGHPAYDVYFANEYERDPVEYKNDFAYPLNRWRAEDGINTKKLDEVFGDSFMF